MERVNIKSKKALFEVIDKTMIIHAKGDLDYSGVEDIKKESEVIFKTFNIQNIIVDFYDSEFMDSSGIGFLVGRYKKIMNCNGKFVAVNMSKSIERIYNMAGLKKIMSKSKNMKEALDYVYQ